MRVNILERTKILIVGFFICITFYGIYSSFTLSPKNFLQISFLDVGQGDSILIQTPRAGKILIDGGRDKSVMNRLGENLSFSTKAIDLVIATHDDSDHIAGLISVLEKYEVHALLYPLVNSSSELSKKLVETAKIKNVKILLADKPTIIKTDDGVILKILFPVKNMDKEFSNETNEVDGNNASVVTQIIFGKNKFLLTGDLPQSGEIFLKNFYGDSLKSDILKLGHHGSDTSTHPEFLQIVSPSLAIVSAGKNNSFGHPHKSVLELCENFGIKVMRTDTEGTIHLYSNGQNIWRE